MTSDLDDLLQSSFYLMYNLRISPSEIDNLSTYEMRKYIHLLNEKMTIESENEHSATKIIGNLFRGRNRK